MKTIPHPIRPGFLFALLLLWACAPPPECALLDATVPGPLSAERAENHDQPRVVARLFTDEARRSADPGFYTLASMAAACAVARDPDDLDAQRIQDEVDYNLHRFEEVERRARARAEQTGSAVDLQLLGDALVEQGQLHEAAGAYQQAANQGASVALLDRIAWLRWQWGDLEGAVEMETRAAAHLDPADPDTQVWVLTQLGSFHTLQGVPAPELDQALGILPDFPAARLARGRLRLFQGDHAGALSDLKAAGPTFEAARALVELDPTVDPGALCAQNPRACALWLAGQPGRIPEAKAALHREVGGEGTTQSIVAHAWIDWREGQDRREVVMTALDSSNRDPQTLLMAGEILGMPRVIETALSFGPGLLPSERARAEGDLLALRSAEAGRPPGPTEVAPR